MEPTLEIIKDIAVVISVVLPSFITFYKMMCRFIDKRINGKLDEIIKHNKDQDKRLRKLEGKK